VTILDSARKPGAKILVSGGSRCNVTNIAVSERDFWGGRPAIVRRILRGFPVHETISFFRELGVTLHEEADGKLFPDTNRAQTVLDALLRETTRLGATLLSAQRVIDVVPEDAGFRVVTGHGDLRAANVVLATGGQSLPKTGSDGGGYDIARRLGHTIVPPAPALVPLLLDEHDDFHRGLSGVSHEVEIAVWIDGAIATRLTGALLWTHFGVSGPVALNASRHWTRAHIEQRAVRLTMSFHPGSSFDDEDARWVDRARDQPKTTIQSMLAERLPASVAAAIANRVRIDASLPLAHLSRDHRRALAHAITAWPLPVAGTRGYNFAEVTTGGVALDEIDPAAMASRICPGLSLVGEILDVDGRIGGFNFQWAWSTGFAAGRALGGGSSSPV